MNNNNNNDNNKVRPEKQINQQKVEMYLMEYESVNIKAKMSITMTESQSAL